MYLHVMGRWGTTYVRVCNIVLHFYHSEHQNNHEGRRLPLPHRLRRRVLPGEDLVCVCASLGSCSVAIDSDRKGFRVVKRWLD